MMSTALSVNINKIATLRNARGKNNPNLIKTAENIVQYGAQGITVHPRPDGRHIRRQDVFDLRQRLSVELNVEGYPSSDFLRMIEEVRPAQCTLVPDPPDALTSNAGWKIEENHVFLRQILQQLKEWKVRSSLFIDPQTITSDEFHLLKDINPDRIELYTEAYAESFGQPSCDRVVQFYQQAAKRCRSLGIGVNAGHDLDMRNLTWFLRQVPDVLEVSIGHALICDALYVGLHDAIRGYLNAIATATD